MTKELLNNELLSRLLCALKDENKKNNQELIKHIEIENSKLVNIIKQQNNKIAELENKCTKLEEKNIRLERRYRKNNVVIFGLDIDAKGNIATTAIRKLNSLLGISLSERDLNNIFPLKNVNKPAIKIEFLSHLTKDIVFQNVRKLKGTNIAIMHDMCYEDRLNHKILVKHLKEARSKNLSAHIKHNRLIINGEAYNIEQLEKNEDTGVEIVEGETNKKRDRNSISAPTSPSISSRERLSHEVNLEDIENEELNQTIKPIQKKSKKQPPIPADIPERRTRQGTYLS